MSQKENLIIYLPLIDWRLGRMVIAPSAISSWCSTGEILEPQLSDPTQIKCPVWLAFFAACRSRLERERRLLKFTVKPLHPELIYPSLSTTLMSRQ